MHPTSKVRGVRAEEIAADHSLIAGGRRIGQSRLGLDWKATATEKISRERERRRGVEKTLTQNVFNSKTDPRKGGESSLIT